MGQLILQRQDQEMANQIHRPTLGRPAHRVPGLRDLCTRNVVYMRTLAAAHPDGITQQPAAQLPWRQIMVLPYKVPD